MTNKATPEQIAEWKAKHGKVFAYQADGKIAYIRTPTIKDLAYAGSAGNSVQMTKAMIDQVWLDGDEEIKTDLNLYLGLAEKVSTLIEAKQGELGEL
jgi:hypothetical protein